MDFTPEEKKVFSRLGKKRFIGKTPQEVSKYMSEVRRKGIARKKRREGFLKTHTYFSENIE